jgi:signal transduction histidine kinase
MVVALIDVIGGSRTVEHADPASASAGDAVPVPRVHLEQLQRIAGVGAVSSSIAHEFNNILTTIINAAKQGLQMPDADVKRMSFDRILSAARRASRITTGVLALSRNRGAKRELTPVVPLVEEVLAVLEKDLSKHRVRLERSYLCEPAASIVPAQIEQVVMNLIINARQAMPSGGFVRVTVGYNAANGFVEISVRDTGVGIGPDMLGKIFDPFFTTKEGPDDAGQGGSGLGLAICREIVERHHGRIRVESAVGRGTTFTIKLPGVKAVEQAA